MYRIGIDLGGTNIAAGVVDGSQHIVAEVSVPTGAERGAEAVVADICRAAELAMAKAGITAAHCASIGIGSPGTCDGSRGVVVRAYNLGWFNVPVCDMVTARLGLPCRLSNDANCAALAETVAGAAVGCRNIQFDDCTWGIYCDTDFVAKTGMKAIDIQKVSELGVRANNLAIEGKPDDLVINTHVCRGNYHSTYAFEGGYDPIAPYLFADENVDAFYLEFDTPRAGTFEPLKYVAPGKKVVLGLVTSKQPGLEDEDLLVSRIHEAAKYVPLENLYLSPQCGFASCECGNKLTEDEQWAKVALVKRVAEKVWGEA